MSPSTRRSPALVVAICTLLAIMLSSCASVGDTERRHLDDIFGSADVEARSSVVSNSVSAEFLNNVRPLLNRRCVVCHACYDAACQLKFTSAEGIDRGASKQAISTPRAFETDPTRLHLDEHSTSAWRSRGFYPILNEREQAPTANLEASLMYRTLALKEAHPLRVASNDPMSEGQRLTGLKERDHCPTVAEFPAYAAERPNAGMPYFLPQLAVHESETLKNWLASGAQMTSPKSEPGHAGAIARWEARLNGSTNKERLIARYVYEHLFLAHLHFDELVGNGQVWYRLVRSSTPPGEPVQPIATRLPFDRPGADPFWFRLWLDPETVVAKSHMPWALNPERMAWLDELFFDADFTVDNLPSYKPSIASNPFLAFEQLPVRSRYRFLLENARFTITGFIKGPVCRGQFALNAIRDHFWVVFVDPEHPLVGDADRFLAELAPMMEFPSGREAYLNLVSVSGRHTRNNHRYNTARAEAITERHSAGDGLSIDDLWDDDGSLHFYTVLRNVAHAHKTNVYDERRTLTKDEDTLDVLRGVVGDYPSAFWHVKEAELDRLVMTASAINAPEDYSAMLDTFGIRRSHHRFWEHADRVHDHLAQTRPIEGGLLDFNRLEIR